MRTRFRTSLNISVLLIALVLIGCTGGLISNSPPVPASPTEPPPAVTSHSGSSAALPAPTAVATPLPADRPTRIPAPGLPSNLLEGRDPLDNPFPPAPDRDLYQLAAQLSLKTGPDEIPRVVNPSPVSYYQGREDTFWLVDWAFGSPFYR